MQRLLLIPKSFISITVEIAAIGSICQKSLAERSITMGILSALEKVLVPSRRPRQQQVALKEIFCNRKDEDYIQRFNTTAVGTGYSNPDGSDRQKALKKLKPGEKVRLIWQSEGSANKEIVYLVRKGSRQELAMPHCFGRLNDKVAADVIRWLNQDNIATSATVVKIVGGTPKRPKLGCILQMTTYTVES